MGGACGLGARLAQADVVERGADDVQRVAARDGACPAARSAPPPPPSRRGPRCPRASAPRRAAAARRSAPLPPTLGPPQKTIARALPSGAQHAMSETAAAIALPAPRRAQPLAPLRLAGALVRAFSLAIAAAAAAVNELGGAAAGPPKAPWWGGAPRVAPPPRRPQVGSAERRWRREAGGQAGVPNPPPIRSP